MRILITGISAMAALACASTARAEEGGWELHGFGDLSVKNDYVTPRGLVVTTDGVTIQVLNGLSLVSPGGVAITAGTWTDLNPGYNPTYNSTVVNEFDFFVGISGKITPRLTAGIEYSQFISPQNAFRDEKNLEFSLKYADGGPDDAFAINPYVKLFWAIDGDSTVVLGKKGGTFDVELGAVPTYKTGDFTLSAPTWITIGPESYWGEVTPDGMLGVVSTGLKGSVPLKFLKGNAGASVYAQVQYYHLINDNLLLSKFLLNGETGRDHVVYGLGFSFGF
jgi:hypothetical protein